jgi:hypothetical protein
MDDVYLREYALNQAFEFHKEFGFDDDADESPAELLGTAAMFETFLKG